MTNDKNVRKLDEKKDTSALAATRRGFLFGLLGGFAAVAGLPILFQRSETAPNDPSGKKPGTGRAGTTPIDNIFVPIQPSKRKLRRK